MPSPIVTTSMTSSAANPLLSPCTLSVYATDAVVDDAHVNDHWLASYDFGDDNAEVMLQGPNLGQSSNLQRGATKRAHCFTVPDGEGVKEFTIRVRLYDTDTDTYADAETTLFVEAQDNRYSAADTIYISNSLVGDAQFIAQDAAAGATYQSTLPAPNQWEGKRVLLFKQDTGFNNDGANVRTDFGQGNFVLGTFGTGTGKPECGPIVLGTRSGSTSRLIHDSDTLAGHPENIIVSEVRTPTISLPLFYRNITIDKPDLDYSAQSISGAGAIWVKQGYDQQVAGNLSPSVYRHPQHLNMNLNGSRLMGSAASGSLRPGLNLGIDAAIYDMSIIGGTFRYADEHNVRLMGGVRHTLNDSEGLGGHFDNPADRAKFSIRATGNRSQESLDAAGVTIPATLSITNITGADDAFTEMKVDAEGKWSWPALQLSCYSDLKIFRETVSTSGSGGLHVFAQTNDSGDGEAFVNGINGLMFYRVVSEFESPANNSSPEGLVGVGTTDPVGTRTQAQKIDNVTFVNFESNRTSSGNVPDMFGTNVPGVTNADETNIQTGSYADVPFPGSNTVVNLGDAMNYSFNNNDLLDDSLANALTAVDATGLQVQGGLLSLTDASQLRAPISVAYADDVILAAIAITDLNTNGTDHLLSFINSASGDGVKLYTSTSTDLLERTFRLDYISSGQNSRLQETVTNKSDYKLFVKIDASDSAAKTFDFYIDDIAFDNASMGPSTLTLLNGFPQLSTMGLDTVTIAHTLESGSPARAPVSTSIDEIIFGQDFTLQEFVAWEPAVYTAPQNQTPTLGSIGPRSYTVGDTIDFTIAATDSDGTIASYSATNLHPDATLNPTTGQVTGTATTVQTISTTFSATDNDGATASEIVVFAVSAPLDTAAPVITFTDFPASDVTANTNLTFNVNTDEPCTFYYEFAASAPSVRPVPFQNLVAGDNSVTANVGPSTNAGLAWEAVDNS